MITLNSLPPDYKKHLMQIDESELKILWARDYDIPRNGIILYKGKHHYFQCKDFNVQPNDFRKRKRVGVDNRVWLDYWCTYLVVETIFELPEISEFSQIKDFLPEIWEKSMVLGWFELFIGSEAEDAGNDGDV